jgi:hypothetical protein
MPGGKMGLDAVKDGGDNVPSEAVYLLRIEAIRGAALEGDAIPEEVKDGGGVLEGGSRQRLVEILREGNAGQRSDHAARVVATELPELIHELGDMFVREATVYEGYPDAAVASRIFIDRRR